MRGPEDSVVAGSADGGMRDGTQPVGAKGYHRRQIQGRASARRDGVMPFQPCHRRKQARQPPGCSRVRPARGRNVMRPGTLAGCQRAQQQQCQSCPETKPAHTRLLVLLAVNLELYPQVGGGNQTAALIRKVQSSGLRGG